MYFFTSLVALERVSHACSCRGGLQARASYKLLLERTFCCLVSRRLFVLSPTMSLPGVAGAVTLGCL